MHKRKIRLGILCGGKSAEHEVSLTSAASVINALDKDKYDICIIGIDKDGAWHLKKATQFLAYADDPKRIQLCGPAEASVLSLCGDVQEVIGRVQDRLDRPLSLDVIFPILHGTYGEDGTIQGVLKMAQLPFVGAGVLGSAIGMDKDVMKRLLKEAGLPLARFLTFLRHQRKQITFAQVVAELGLPFFVKPANLGSSIGISKVKSEEGFAAAVEKAFRFDRKIVIEECIRGREIECSVLGNEEPIASLPGELIPTHEFYSYEAKYLDKEGAHFKIPAELSPGCMGAIQEMALRAFRTLCCEGMARVDFFLTPDDKLYVNEINTIPGFTAISMYPKLWEASGLPYSQLLDRLITLALERHEKEKQLETRDWV